MPDPIISEYDTQTTYEEYEGSERPDPGNYDHRDNPQQQVQRCDLEQAYRTAVWFTGN